MYHNLPDPIFKEFDEYGHHYTDMRFCAYSYDELCNLINFKSWQEFYSSHSL